MHLDWIKSTRQPVTLRMEDFNRKLINTMEWSDFESQIEAFREDREKTIHPLVTQEKEQWTLVKPNLFFEQTLPKGDLIWAYTEEGQPVYCLLNTESWRGKGYAFFTNRQCEYFPCHQGVKHDQFNCLFCYCPLYALGKDCGGNFAYYGEVKDCSNCTIPHQKNKYGYILSKYPEILALASRQGKDEK